MGHNINYKRNIPLGKILPLTLTSFLAILTETIPVGMLLNISSTFNISQSLAGQMVSSYAAGAFISAIPIIAMTRGMNRKVLLLLSLLGFFLTNIGTAFVNNYQTVLIIRFFAGVSAGVAWGLLTGYTVRLVDPSRHGKAIAIMSIGGPVALAAGVPFSAYFVNIFPWQYLFHVISSFAFVVMVWVIFFLPGFPGEKKEQRKSLSRIIFQKQIIIILLMLFFWISAHNLMYTYMSSLLELSKLYNHLDSILFVFGGFSISGIIITSFLADKFLAKITYYSMALFMISGVILFLYNHNIVAVYCSVTIWGIAFGGAPALLAKYLSDSAGKDIDIAQSSFVTVFNMAISFGALIGGVILSSSGASFIPLYQAGLSIISLVILIIFLHRERVTS